MSFKDKGFTLIEVIIGMSLLSVMMLLLFSSMRICVQNWNAGEKKIVQVSQAAIVQNFFQSKLHASLPLDADFLEEPQFSFQGSINQLQFVAAMPASAGRLGLQLFSINLQPGKTGEGSELSVDIKPFFSINENEEWQDAQIVILNGIQALRFGYYGPDEDDEDSEWHDEWMEKQALPKLVSIDIELINGEVWPQVIVPLMVDGAVKPIKSQGQKRNSKNIFEQRKAKTR